MVFGAFFQPIKTGGPASPAIFASHANGDGMTATATVSRPLRKLLAAGPAIFRDSDALFANDAYPAELLPELEALCLPRISEAEGKEVIALLKAHAGRVRYVVEREESRSEHRRRAARGGGARLRRRNRAAPPLPIAGSDRLHQIRRATETAADDGRGGTGSRSLQEPRQARFRIRRDRRRGCRL